MQLLHAIKDFNFTSPVLGEGSLKRGKTYYTFGKFARNISSLNAGIILEDEPAVSPFSLQSLNDPRKGLRVLLIHSGGYGDTIAVGILLNLLSRKYGIRFDICGHHDKWAYILKPMGFNGEWVSYPPEVERLRKYDYVLTDLASFTRDPMKLLTDSPLKILADIFNISIDEHDIRYVVPEHVKGHSKLPSTNKLRVGLNFDSMGLVKSYPAELQADLVKGLLLLDLELHFFGTRTLSPDINHADGRVHNHTGRTGILELAALIDQMDFILGVDSFVAHLAGILGKRALVLLSTTGDHYFHHYPGCSALASRIPCAPCFHPGDTCPQGHPQCLAFHHESITAEKLLGTLINELTGMYGNRHG